MSERGPEIAVVGAGGRTGGEALNMLQERRFGGNVSVYGKDRSVGQETAYGRIEALPDELPEFDYVLLATDEETSDLLIPRFREAGATAFDFSTMHREDEDVLLLNSAVNVELLMGDEELVSLPNCSAAILTTAVAPIDRACGVVEMTVTADQSVSGTTGGEAELRIQSVQQLCGASVDFPEVYSEKIAFNIIPQIGETPHGQDSAEEEKIRQESRKIMENSDLKVYPTCKRVAVFRGHTIDVNLITVEQTDLGEIERLFRANKHIEYQPHRSATPERAAGKNAVFVDRLRVNLEDPRRVQFTVIGDNLRRGAGLNGVEGIKAMEARRSE